MILLFLFLALSSQNNKMYGFDNLEKSQKLNLTSENGKGNERLEFNYRNEIFKNENKSKQWNHPYWNKCDDNRKWVIENRLVNNSGKLFYMQFLTYFLIYSLFNIQIILNISPI